MKTWWWNLKFEPRPFLSTEKQNVRNEKWQSISGIVFKSFEMYSKVWILVRQGNESQLHSNNTTVTILILQLPFRFGKKKISCGEEGSRGRRLLRGLGEHHWGTPSTHPLRPTAQFMKPDRFQGQRRSLTSMLTLLFVPLLVMFNCLV